MWPITGVSCYPAIFWKLHSKCHFLPTVFAHFLLCPLLLLNISRSFLFFFLNPAFSLTTTTFCDNEFVSEGKRKPGSEREKWKVREKAIESERKRDTRADGMNAKNQQSHVRPIKINSFSLHSLCLSLFLFSDWRAQGVLSKCLLRKSRNTS